MSRKIQIGVIGSNNSTSSPEIETFSEKLGEALIDNGYRIICGGYGGIMEAIPRGAKMSSKYQTGDTIGILPSINNEESNEYIDISIATGMNYARNQVIVASSDVLIAIGGGAGTLSEIAFAWQLDKPIIAVDIGESWSSKLAGIKLDSRRENPIARASSVEDVLDFIKKEFH